MAHKTFGSQHRQALKSKGCPDNVISQLQQHGCDPDECVALVNLNPSGSFDWQALITFVAQHGPQLLAEILAIFGKQPAPAPAPPPAPNP